MAETKQNLFEYTEESIKSLDWRVRRAKRIGHLPADVLHETVGKILALVDPDAP